MIWSKGSGYFLPWSIIGNFSHFHLQEGLSRGRQTVIYLLITSMMNSNLILCDP